MLEVCGSEFPSRRGQENLFGVVPYFIKFQSKTVYSNQKQGYARILPASLFERHKRSAGWEENEDGG